MLIFSILLSTIAPATKSYASENQSSTFKEVTNNQSDVKVTDDGIFINDKFYTQKEFTNLLDNAILISERNTNKISTRSAAVADAGAALVAGTWWIPGVGEVVVTVAGAVIVAGAVVAVGSWAYKVVTKWFKNRAYNKAKENGTKTNDHSTQTGRSLPTKSRPNSSKDRKDSKTGKVVQRRYYDKDGNADMDIDYTNHGNPKKHPKVPHRHNWKNGKRGPAY
ncbi:MAG: hypothetical protein Q4E50_07120 [Tissierellia bacterium]|nr:hypothetical protein [Tissierellia bacterium]